MIEVYIGTEPKTEIARKVLEFSIEKYTSQKVEFHPMMGDDWTIQPNNRVGTGFSLFRWDIPERQNHKGYAIYLDADILALGDIKGLWEADVNYPNDRASVWCTYQKSKHWPDKDTPETSVMFIDCKKAEFNQMSFDSILSKLEGQKDRKLYIEIMRALNHQHAPQRIPNSWNRLNNIVEGDTYLLHYTKEPEQPWYNPKHRHRDIWEQHLKEAIDAGKVDKEEIKEAVKNFKPHKAGVRGTGMHPYWLKVT